MNRWEIIPSAEAKVIWDRRLIQFPNHSPFQTYAWGQYNRSLGWEPHYLVGRDESGEIRSMMLGLLRRYPFKLGVLWSPGGPVGTITEFGANWPREISAAIGIKRLYLRIRFDRKNNVNEALALHNLGLTRSWFMMQSGFTMNLDLTNSPKELLAGCSKSWRKNLRSSLKKNNDIKLWQNPDIEQLSNIFSEMQRNKNLPELFSRNKLKYLFDRAGKNLICMRAVDPNGKVLAVRACLTHGDRACDYIAATNLAGRNSQASYALLWKLLEVCRQRGIKDYDLGGIDPYGNPGVYAFKSRTGAIPIEFLGEWDWAGAPWLRWFGNWSIRRRERIKKPVSGREKSRSETAAAIKAGL